MNIEEQLDDDSFPQDIVENKTELTGAKAMTLYEQECFSKSASWLIDLFANVFYV